jgi:hypothetical protein
VNPALVWTETSASLLGITNISFYTRNNFSSSTVQVAVRIGSQWYVSTTQLVDFTGNNPPWALQVFQFVPDAGLWQLLDVSTLVLGEFTAEPLPTGPITAVGLYALNPAGSGSKIRFDEFQVTGSVALAAPTPSILPVFRQGGNLVIRTVTAAGWDYVLESALNLQPPVTWIPIQTNSGTGSVITNTVPVNPTGNQFFRYHLQ